MFFNGPVNCSLWLNVPCSQRSAVLKFGVFQKFKFLEFEVEAFFKILSVTLGCPGPGRYFAVTVTNSTLTVIPQKTMYEGFSFLRTETTDA
jgi:hypothetical protein